MQNRCVENRCVGTFRRSSSARRVSNLPSTASLVTREAHIVVAGSTTEELRACNEDCIAHIARPTILGRLKLSESVPLITNMRWTAIWRNCEFWQTAVGSYRRCTARAGTHLAHKGVRSNHNAGPLRVGKQSGRAVRIWLHGRPAPFPRRVWGGAHWTRLPHEGVHLDWKSCSPEIHRRGRAPA